MENQKIKHIQKIPCQPKYNVPEAKLKLGLPLLSLSLSLSLCLSVSLSLFLFFFLSLSPSLSLCPFLYIKERPKQLMQNS